MITLKMFIHEFLHKQKNMLKKLIDKYNCLPVQIKASFWFLICSFLQRGISTITVPIFTRILTSTEYGRISVFNSWNAIISVFVTLNLFSGVYLRGLVAYEENRKEFISSMQGLCFSLVVIWLVIYFAFESFWNNLFNLSTNLMLLMFVHIWLSASFSFWATEQKVEYKYARLVGLTLLMAILSPALSVYLVLNCNDKVMARIAGGLIVQGFLYGWLFFYHLKNGKRFFSKVYWKYALCFNLPLIPHYLSTIILNSSDRIMIADMVDNKSAGIYSLSYSVSMVLTIFNSSLLSTVEPWIYQKLKSNDLLKLPKVAYCSLSLIAGINIALIAFAPEIIAFFAPKEYYDAVWIIPPVAMSVYFMFSYSYFAAFEFYYKKTGYIAIATMAGAVLNIVLNYIFIKLYGYYAAGYTTLICYIIYAVAHYVFMSRVCNEFLNGNKVYSLKILLLITLVFMTIGFAFLATYGNMTARYSLIAILVLVTLLKHKLIISSIKNFINIKKNKED